MKVTKLKSLHEAVTAQLNDVSDLDYGAVNPVYADAVRQGKKNAEHFEEVIKKRSDFKVPERKAKEVKGTPEMKKLHLSESLFSHWLPQEPLLEKVDIDDEPYISEEEIAASEYNFVEDEEEEDVSPIQIDQVVAEAQAFVDSALQVFGKITPGIYKDLEDLGLYVDESNGKFIVRKKESNDPSVEEELEAYSGPLTLGEGVEEETKYEDSTRDKATKLNPDMEYFYQQTRMPLYDVIQCELTVGERGYAKSKKTGAIKPRRLPSLNYDIERLGVGDNEKGDYIYLTGKDEADLQPAVEAIKKYNREYEITQDKWVRGPFKYQLRIYLKDEDFYEPYVDPNAPVYSKGKSKS